MRIETLISWVVVFSPGLNVLNHTIIAAKAVNLSVPLDFIDSEWRNETNKGRKEKEKNRNELAWQRWQNYVNRNSLSECNRRHALDRRDRCDEEKSDRGSVPETVTVSAKWNRCEQTKWDGCCTLSVFINFLRHAVRWGNRIRRSLCRPRQYKTSDAEPDRCRCEPSDALGNPAGSVVRVETF